MGVGKLATILLLCVCFLNVHSLNVKKNSIENPLGIKGKALIQFVNGLHAGLETFSNKAVAGQIFGQVADIIIKDGPKEMSKKGVSAFLNNSSKQIGGTGVPPFIVDRFWNESVKHTRLNGEEALTFAAWQAEMVFCLKRDITDFTKDIIKEDPKWKYVKAAAPVADPTPAAPVAVVDPVTGAPVAVVDPVTGAPVAVVDPVPAAPVAVVDPVEVAPVDTKEGKRPHGKGKGKGHHGKDHGKNHGKKNGKKNGKGNHGKGNHGKKNGKGKHGKNHGKGNHGKKTEPK